MPALVEAEPAQTLFAEETYQFALRFDEAVTIVSQDALRFASNGVELPGLAAGATVSSEGHVIRFEYTVPSEAAREDGVGGHAARRSGAGRHAARAAERCDVHATCGESLRSRLSGRAGRQHGSGSRSRSRNGSVQMSAKQRAVRVPVRKAGRVDGVLSVWSVRCLLNQQSVRCLLNQQSRNRGINGK